MIQFSNCKINLGLNVIRKRPDGYHDIESIMFPLHSFADAIEIVRAEGSGVEFSSSGIEFDCAVSDNLCIKAYNLMQSRYGIGGVKMHIHKTVPFGAGLGGGSSNAVTVLKLLDSIFDLRLSNKDLESLAGELGSDTVFFVGNTPAIIKGRGEVVVPIDLNLSGYHAVIVKPDVAVSTAMAYSGIVPKIANKTIENVIMNDVSQWKNDLVNDFEDTVFKKYPELGEIKQMLYSDGAIYAAMSGSGSTIFGLFSAEPRLNNNYEGAFVRNVSL